MDSQELLRAAHLRMTAPRLAVLEALDALGPHQSADAIASEARARLGTLSTQAVYDNLHVFVEAGVVRRIKPAQGAALYELRAGDNHHHLVCTCCGVTRDVDCAVGHAPCLEPEDAHGFRIDEAEVTFRGLCESCQQAPQQVLAEPNTSGGNNEQADK